MDPFSHLHPLGLPFLGVLLAGAVPIQTSVPASAGDPGDVDVSDLMDLSLEELMNVEVTVASRTPQKLSDVPAAVYVIPGDEIRRAGHRSIQEALRMVPGMYVSHWTNDMWDVTARGFGSGLSLTSEAYLNQLLIMIDGVVVYTPLFAGMWWALQEVDLDDVDRIEVIRGPGGIVWGANTVHGVVNVITKRAADTQGARLDGRLGTDQWDSSARYGGPLGENGNVRVWAKTTHYDTPKDPWLGFPSNWAMRVGGFRTDWKTEDGRELTLWGRGYDGSFNDVAFDLVTYEPFADIAVKHGGQVAFSIANPETGSRWHAWYLRDQQNVPTYLDLDIDVFDVEYHRDQQWTDRQRLTWGAGYQVVHSDLAGDDPLWLDFDPISQVQNNFRAFLVDTIDFPARDLQLVLGAQILQTEFGGFDVQPNVRLRWRPNGGFMGWAGVSRAVRTPSLEEVSLTDWSYYAGNDDFESEELLAFEVGFRNSFTEKVAVDVAAYYNDYDELHVLVYDPDTYWGGRIQNLGEGTAWGAEVAVDAKPSDRWSLRSAYSYIHGDYEFAPTGESLPTDDYHPKHVASVRSYYDVADDWELDAAVYVVEGMGSRYDIAEYVRTDVRVGWHPSENLELSAGVQDLNDPDHSELLDTNLIRRAVYVQLTYRR
ncbi:MAG: TonB-dependent receptor plug domain-containing protein [Planctomycetota bacterium]